MNNFKSEEPHWQSNYYVGLLLQEKSWYLDDLIAALPDLTVDALKNFIPTFFARMHVECLVYGNSTESQAFSIYTKVADKLRTEFDTK